MSIELNEITLPNGTPIVSIAHWYGYHIGNAIVNLLAASLPQPGHETVEDEFLRVMQCKKALYFLEKYTQKEDGTFPQLSPYGNTPPYMNLVMMPDVVTQYILDEKDNILRMLHPPKPISSDESECYKFLELMSNLLSLCVFLNEGMPESKVCIVSNIISELRNLVNGATKYYGLE